MREWDGNSSNNSWMHWRGFVFFVAFSFTPSLERLSFCWLLLLLLLLLRTLTHSLSRYTLFAAVSALFLSLLLPVVVVVVPPLVSGRLMWVSLLRCFDCNGITLLCIFIHFLLVFVSLYLTLSFALYVAGVAFLMTLLHRLYGSLAAADRYTHRETEKRVCYARI